MWTNCTVNTGEHTFSLIIYSFPPTAFVGSCEGTQWVSELFLLVSSSVFFLSPGGMETWVFFPFMFCHFSKLAGLFKLRFTFMKTDVNTLLCVLNHPTKLNIVFLSIFQISCLGFVYWLIFFTGLCIFCINLWNNLASLKTTKYSITNEFNPFKASWITWHHFQKQQKSQIVIFLFFLLCFLFS